MIEKEFHFEPRVFASGELEPAVGRVASLVFGRGCDVRVSLHRTLGDGAQQHEPETGPEALSSVCDLRNERTSICLRFRQERSNHLTAMALTAWVYGKSDGFLSLHVDTDSANTLNKFADVFQDELRLAVAPDPMTRLAARMGGDKTSSGRIFIGHGTSALWLSLKDFLVNDLGLDYDEFNRESTAGYSTKERLEQMLRDASFAFLIMTAEDEYADGTQHARENVIHEVGLFQGCHGFARAIVLLEDGCAEFSNIRGLTQIRFPKDNILAQSDEIRRVLQREGVFRKG